jgi:hypothetical protein
MEKIKINFTDFWNGFDVKDNIFINLLRYQYEVVLDENPDILFFSCYGFEHLKYNCYKVFFTGENVRPDFRICDLSLSFDWDTYQNRNIRLPLIRFNGSLESIAENPPTNAAPIAERKFCCMLVSNPNCKERNIFYEKLSRYKKVDSGGKFKNNISRKIINKHEFMQQYKFVLAFENSCYPGYTSEKILDPILASSVPVYWGNTLIGKDINVDRIINVHKYSDFDEAVSSIIQFDNDINAYNQIVSAPIFPNGILPLHLTWNDIEQKLFSGIAEMLQKRPVAEKEIIYPIANKYKRLIKSKFTSKPHWYC